MFRAIVAAMILAALAGGAQLRYDNGEVHGYMQNQYVLVDFDIPVCGAEIDSISVRVLARPGATLYACVFNKPGFGPDSTGYIITPDTAIWQGAVYGLPVGGAPLTVTIPTPGLVLPADSGDLQVVFESNAAGYIRFARDASPGSPRRSWYSTQGGFWCWREAPGDIHAWVDYNGTQALDATWGSIKASF